MWKRLNVNRFLLAVLLTIVSLGSGLLGFIVIEKFSLVDALYMTMITVSTVGFGELHPLLPAGRFATATQVIPPTAE